MCNGVTTQNNCSTPPNHTTAEAANDMFTSCATGNIDNSEDIDSWRMTDQQPDQRRQRLRLIVVELWVILERLCLRQATPGMSRVCFCKARDSESS